MSKLTHSYARESGLKFCGACELSKEKDQFHRHKGKPDGLSWSCKSCSLKKRSDPQMRALARERYAKYCKANPERVKQHGVEASRKFRETSPLAAKAHARNMRASIEHYWKRREQSRAKLGNKCACSLPNCWHPQGSCPCNDPRALHIDHVNGDGQKDRKRRTPYQILGEVLTDTTGKFQLLCASCNWVKRIEAKEGPHSKYRP